MAIGLKALRSCSAHVCVSGEIDGGEQIRAGIREKGVGDNVVRAKHTKDF